MTLDMHQAMIDAGELIPRERMPDVLRARLDAMVKHMRNPIRLPPLIDDTDDGWEVELPWSISHLAALLDPYDALPLECDGMTRVLHTVLTHYRIPHVVWDGTVHASEGFRLGVTTDEEPQHIDPHMWITLPVAKSFPFTIDYRLRMWLGDAPHIPHGIFDATNWPGIVYIGEQVKIGILDEVVFQVLTTP